MKDITCPDCGRFLFKQAGTVVLEALTCPNSACKAKMNIKIISADQVADMRHKFVTPEKPSRLKGKDVEVS